MRFIQLILKLKLMIFTAFVAILLSISMPEASFALTPIAHTDVVPSQRIEYGTSFNFGVVAFSKAGIDRVDFAISGQGYTGETKSSSSMALNTRVASTSPGAEYPGVYEYFVAISANEFTSNGIITITPNVYGSDGGIKTLAPVALYVEALDDETPTEAWVDPAISDGTGTLDDEEDPFPTISSAISAVQTANGDCDYATIYLAEGTYNTGITGSTRTSSEWLTITRKSGAAIENVIIDEDGTSYDTDYIKMQGVTLRSSGESDYAIDTYGAWIDQCRTLGNAHAFDLGGIRQSNPVKNAAYITSTSVYDVNFGIQGTNIDIVRGFKVSYILDDFSQNKDNVLFVNCKVDDIWGAYSNSYDGGWHADLFQMYNAACNGNTYDNIIFYNVIATNLQYGTLFLNGWGTMGNAHTNIAFVNTFMEWRNPTTNNYAWIYDKWNHFLMWHCTISISDDNPSTGYWKLRLYDYPDPCSTDSPQQQDNVSYIGNVLYGFEIIGTGSPRGTAYLNSGNTYGNEAKYNHYETSSSTNPGEDYTTGRTVLNWDNPNSSTYGFPISGSSIENRLPSNLTGVLCDAYGNHRDSRPDAGAFEAGTASHTLLSPQNIMIVNN